MPRVKRRLVPGTARTAKYWRTLIRGIVGAVGLVLALMVAPATLAAPDPARSLTLGEIDALLARLTDAEARRLLGERLRAGAQETAPAVDGAHGGLGVALVQLRAATEGRVAAWGGYFDTLRAGAALLPRALPSAVGSLAGSGPRPVLGLLAALGGVLFAGAAAYALVRWCFRRARSGLEAQLREPLFDRFARLALRALVETAAIAVFALVSFALTSILYGADPATREFVFAYVTGVLVVLLAYVLSRLVLAPHAPLLRVFPLGDRAARFLHRWWVAIAATGTVVWLTAGLVILTGVPMSVHLLIVVASGGVLALLMVAMILASRGVVGAALAPSPGVDRSGAGGVLRRSWHWVAIAYTLFVYLLWSNSMLARSSSALWPAVGSVILVAALVALDAAVRRGLERIFAGARPRNAQTSADGAQEYTGWEDGRPEPESALSADLPVDRQTRAEDSPARYRSLLGGVARAALCVVGAAMLAELWGAGTFGLLGSDGRAAFVGGVIRLGIGIAVAWLLWRLARAVIDPHLPQEREISQGEDAAGAAQSRTETLLPLLRMTIAVLLVVFTTMISLSAMGVDIGPLLAGAGVIGLAVGFGAQALVKDIVSGIFFLIDDAFRVGEYIEFGDLRGEVEGISLRSLKLRHHRGAVHTVPFGELRSVTNYNRDWVIYKMEFRLPIDTDVEKVRKLVKKLGQQLMDDPEHGSSFLQPLKSQGISAVEDGTLVLRTKFMCRPRSQFILRRVAYQRLQQVFAENGIRLVARSVRVDGPTQDPPSGQALAASEVLREPSPG